MKTRERNLYYLVATWEEIPVGRQFIASKGTKEVKCRKINKYQYTYYLWGMKTKGFNYWLKTWNLLITKQTMNITRGGK